MTLSQAEEEPLHQPEEDAAATIARSPRRPERFAAQVTASAMHRMLAEALADLATSDRDVGQRP